MISAGVTMNALFAVIVYTGLTAIYGVQEDPMILARSAETTELSAAAKAQFLQVAQGLKSQLDVADTVVRSGSYAE